MSDTRLSKFQTDLLLWAYRNRPTDAVNVVWGARLKWPRGFYHLHAGRACRVPCDT